jgi:hypothetical protein
MLGGSHAFHTETGNQGDLHPNYLVITYFDSKKKVETSTSLFSLKSVSQHYETTSNTTTMATALYTSYYVWLHSNNT